MPSCTLPEEDKASPKAGGQDANDVDDPVVATYSVFIKPPLPDNRELLILQYVNKTSQDPAHIRPPRISELRVKPKTGMFEVDVAVDTSQAYDQAKGIKWGTALQKSMETRKGGSLGLAGGFGIGGAGPRGAPPGGRRGANSEDAAPLTWQEATRQDKVLRAQTLGGGRGAEEQTANYMVGVFQGKNIHLTPVSSLVHLRPVPHHIDAATEQDRLSRPAQGGAAAAGADKNAGRAIHMTLKAAMEDGGVATETMADRLRAVQTEHWRGMEWVDDETEAAWEAYNECVFLRPGDAPRGNNTEGKGKEPATEAPGDDSGAPDLLEKVTRLGTDWGEEELLRAVSGIEPNDPKPGEEAVTEAARTKVDQQSKDKGKAPAPAPAPSSLNKETEKPEEPKKRPGRPAKSATTAPAAAPKRGGRARAAGRSGGSGTGPSNAMQID